MKILIFSFVFLLSNFLNRCEVQSGAEKNYIQSDFKLGNEVLLNEKIDLLSGKRIGVITNQSGITSSGSHIIDELKGKANVVKIFSPEHGFRGDDNTGSYVDAQTGINVVSLYGGKKKPSSGDLNDVDVLVYDIQDVGARFYTYINTLYYCMEAANSSGKSFIVCDRPVMINPDYTDGFMLEDDCKSFVGMLDIPAVYGLTCGELSNFLNDTYFDGRLNLEVVQMSNYSRSIKYESLKLKWINPSPSIYFPGSAVCYAGTCLFEGTNFSEGRGTDRPFEYLGAPYCDGDKLVSELEQYNLPGVKFERISFIPSSITSPSNPPKFVGEKCEGIFVNVQDIKSFQPFKTAIAIIISCKKLFPEFNLRKDKFIDKLAGTKTLREMLNSNKNLSEITESYSTNLEVFKNKREKYIIYK
ncbi:MAG: DUF1343 domain-containing protein [Ignavibacteria bacterium]|nr:DUF1343 domain-containing protein [Ignavibacteria bacterium]